MDTLRFNGLKLPKYLDDDPERKEAVSYILDSLHDDRINQKRYFDVLNEPMSKSRAIRAFCCMCMGYEMPEKHIKKCTDLSCPLYLQRPFKNEKTKQTIKDLKGASDE